MEVGPDEGQEDKCVILALVVLKGEEELGQESWRAYEGNVVYRQASSSVYIQLQLQQGRYLAELRGGR